VEVERLALITGLEQFEVPGQTWRVRALQVLHSAEPPKIRKTKAQLNVVMRNSQSHGRIMTIVA